MKHAVCVLAIVSLLCACSGNADNGALDKFIVPDEKYMPCIKKIERVLPAEWKIERAEACDAPDEWQRIGAGKGLHVLAWQKGVLFMEHCSKSGDDYEYTPTVHIYLMPPDWEGAMFVAGDHLLVKGGKLMKPKVGSYANQAVSPARFLGACEEGLVFGEIPWPEHWKSFEEDIVKVFRAKLEISNEYPLCGSKLMVEKAVEGAGLVIHAEALNRPVGKSNESGVITWIGKFEIISVLKGHIAGGNIEVHYQCIESGRHEGYVGEGEEAILFVKEEGEHVVYFRAAKVIWATDKNLKEVEEAAARQDGS